MDDTKAIDVLTRMLKDPRLSEDEREAVKEAIGILAWSKLAEGRIASMKRARDRRAD